MLVQLLPLTSLAASGGDGSLVETVGLLAGVDVEGVV